MVIPWVILLLGFNVALTGSYLDDKTAYKEKIVNGTFGMMILLFSFAFILVFFQKWLREKRKRSYFINRYKILCDNEIVFKEHIPNSIMLINIQKEKKDIERYLKLIKLQTKIKK